MEFTGQILEIEGDQVRRQFAGGVFDDVAELGQLVGNGQFARIVERGQIDIDQTSRIAGPLVDDRTDMAWAYWM